MARVPQICIWQVRREAHKSVAAFALTLCRTEKPEIKATRLAPLATMGEDRKIESEPMHLSTKRADAKGHEATGANRKVGVMGKGDGVLARDGEDEDASAAMPPNESTPWWRAAVHIIRAVFVAGAVNKAALLL